MANEVFGWGHKKVNLQLRTREKLLKDSNRSTRQKVREEPHGTEFNILLILMVLVKRMTITCNKMQTLVFYVAKWCRQWCISTPGVAEFQGDIRCQRLFIFIVGLTISNTFGCQPCAASTHTHTQKCVFKPTIYEKRGRVHYLVTSHLSLICRPSTERQTHSRPWGFAQTAWNRSHRRRVGNHRACGDEDRRLQTQQSLCVHQSADGRQFNPNLKGFPLAWFHSPPVGFGFFFHIHPQQGKI